MELVGFQALREKNFKGLCKLIRYLKALSERAGYSDNFAIGGQLFYSGPKILKRLQYIMKDW